MCGHKCAERQLGHMGIVIGFGKLIFANQQIRQKKGFTAGRGHLARSDKDMFL